MSARSYLFVPGHRPEMMRKAVTAGADEVIYDLEDAVPDDAKDVARGCVTTALAETPAWVRVNAVKTSACERDLIAVGDVVAGIRLPKVASANDVAWAAERLPPGTPLLVAIETAAGVLAVADIARAGGVVRLAMGGLDLRADLGTSSREGLLYAAGAIVVASRAAGLPAPVDSVYPRVRDTRGLADECRWSRSVGFGGKSAIHPGQLTVIHEAFGATSAERAWAREILAAHERNQGEPTVTDDGEFIDAPVVVRAQAILKSRDRS